MVNPGPARLPDFALNEVIMIDTEQTGTGALHQFSDSTVIVEINDINKQKFNTSSGE